MNLKKLDGSFNITVNGMPYNTIEGDKYFEKTLALYNSNSELFEIETVKVKTLEELKAEKIAELKAEKIAELKANRTAYKKTIIIKDDISLADLEVGSNNYENLIRLKYGWIQTDLDLYDVEMEKMIGIADKNGNFPIGSFNYIKNLINNATLDIIDSISTIINPEEV